MVQLHEVLINSVNMVMNNDDIVSFNIAINCYISSKALAGGKIRDHCYITGKYGAQNVYNLLLRIYASNTKVLEVFHYVRRNLVMQAFTVRK